MDAPDAGSTDTVVSHADSGDAALVRDYRAGDEDAARSLYTKYARRLAGLARRYCTPAYAGRFDADDVVQSVFRTFFHGVRRRAYDVPPQGEIWNLLTVLALNKIRSLVGHHRAERRAVHQTWSGTNLDQHTSPASAESADVFLRMVLNEQLDGMPESNRAIVRLRMDGYEIEEIVTRTGRSRRTVERVLQDFRTQLAQP